MAFMATNEKINTYVLGEILEFSFSSRTRDQIKGILALVSKSESEKDAPISMEMAQKWPILGKKRHFWP